MRTLLSDLVHVRNNCSSVKIGICRVKCFSKNSSKVDMKRFKMYGSQILIYFFVSVNGCWQIKKEFWEFLFIKSSSLILQSVLPKNCSFKAVWNLQFSGWIKHLKLFSVIAVVKKQTVLLGHVSQLPKQHSILFLTFDFFCLMLKRHYLGYYNKFFLPSLKTFLMVNPDKFWI